VPVDPDVIAALETVVEREPSNLALSLHLAGLLLDDGRPRDALRHARRILEIAPADRGALELESRASALLDARTSLRLLLGDRDRDSDPPA
jgi:thioredoxin-like negative regulator of GroEL